jgi:putative DNA methylase
MKYKKKLIEVSLPLELINEAATHEKLVKVGKPTSVHLWWARRPLSSARAVIFSQMVDDPSENSELFPTAELQDKERKRLFDIIAELVKWENTNNRELLEAASNEIWKCWKNNCDENINTPNSRELFDKDVLPAFHDPFAGGGALPLEAQRLGLKSFASDLNPVSVLINKALIEFPVKFSNLKSVNIQSSNQNNLLSSCNTGVSGLVEDLRFYGELMRSKAAEKLTHLYPKIKITQAMADARSDLSKYVGRDLTVISWLWVRTAKSPNPAFASVDVPLASTFMLSTKPGKEIYVEPEISENSYKFNVRTGKPINQAKVTCGTKSGSSGTSFLCLLSGTPLTFEYLRAEAKESRIGSRLLAVVCEGDRSRIYLSPTDEIESVANCEVLIDVPDTELPLKALGFRVQEYGMKQWRDLFTKRQLVGLATFSDLILEIKEKIRFDAVQKGFKDDDMSLEKNGSGAKAYSDAIVIYLALALSRTTDWSNSLSRWESKAQVPQQLFGRHAIPMVWDYSETNLLCDSTGSFIASVENICKSFNKSFAGNVAEGVVFQADAQTQKISHNKVISTDPPYYDNIGYADLSDFFYVWLRRSLKSILPDLFSTLTVPKTDELVANPFRHGSKEGAEHFFLDGMTYAMSQLSKLAHPFFPITIYYAFKQAETKDDTGTSSTGWETFLQAVIDSGLSISGTWPMRTEMASRMISSGTNALASSIVLVCRQKSKNDIAVTRREFLSTLKSEMPIALSHLQEGSIAPVDLAQAAIGPGMAVYTKFSKVIDADGKKMTVRDALSVINQTLDEALAQQEGDFDADTRWALTWFDQLGFAEGDYGVAEQLSKSKNTAVAGLVDGGILISKAGKVRLLKPAELSSNWDPTIDTRLTVWEMVHHLIRELEGGGEAHAAALLAKLGSKAETARELCYRLYTLCERRKRATEAMSYNGLVQSWPEISRLANSKPVAGKAKTTDMFEQD